MAQLFISYSHKDKEYAHKLQEACKQRGIDAWIDDRIDYGSQWPDEIEKRLESCDALILIMTPRSKKSEWVQNELNRAKRKKKKIFPLLLEGDEPWLAVETLQYADVTDKKLPPEKFYDALKRTIRIKQLFQLDRITDTGDSIRKQKIVEISNALYILLSKPFLIQPKIMVGSFRISCTPLFNLDPKKGARPQEGYYTILAHYFSSNNFRVQYNNRKEEKLLSKGWLLYTHGKKTLVKERLELASMLSSKKSQYAVPHLNKRWKVPRQNNDKKTNLFINISIDLIDSNLVLGWQIQDILVQINK